MKRRFFLAAALTAMPLLAACAEPNLFAGRDPTEERLKYFDDDSAVKASKMRVQNNQWGFGAPGGIGAQ